MDVAKNSILIVDNEESTLLHLDNLLSEEYTLHLARDGKEAVQKALELQPDLIILDIHLPGMDGYAAITILKSSDATHDIPIVIMSSNASIEDEEKGLAQHVADYIAKPFSDTIMRIRVNNQMRIINQMRAIERLSMIDQLTDIPNRRRFDQQLHMEWRRAIRDQLPLCLLMIDVDKFKDYNDTYGHQQGDVVLQTVARTLIGTLKRPADFAARWGGEEFAVLLPHTELEGGMMIAELIRANIEAEIIACPDSTETHVTVSIGVHVQVPLAEDSIDQFITKSDMALYTAKRLGRNQVCAHMD